MTVARQRSVCVNGLNIKTAVTKTATSAATMVISNEPCPCWVDGLETSQGKLRCNAAASDKSGRTELRVKAANERKCYAARSWTGLGCRRQADVLPGGWGWNGLYAHIVQDLGDGHGTALGK